MVGASCPSFPQICERSGLSNLAPLVDASVLLVCAGAGTAYLMIAGDTMARVASGPHRNGGLWGERGLWIVLSTAFVTPLCCMEKIDALAYTSAAALVSASPLGGCGLGGARSDRSRAVGIRNTYHSGVHTIKTRRNFSLKSILSVGR